MASGGDLRGQIDALFLRAAQHGQARESAIVYARASEVTRLADVMAVASGAPAHAPPKSRVMILGACEDGSVALHKARQNSDGSVQIGRTWNVVELSSLQLLPSDPRILLVNFSKPYYWLFSSASKCSEFVNALRSTFEAATGFPLQVTSIDTQLPNSLEPTPAAPHHREEIIQAPVMPLRAQARPLPNPTSPTGSVPSEYQQPPQLRQQSRVPPRSLSRTQSEAARYAGAPPVPAHTVRRASETASRSPMPDYAQTAALTASGMTAQLQSRTSSRGSDRSEAAQAAKIKQQQHEQQLQQQQILAQKQAQLEAQQILAQRREKEAKENAEREEKAREESLQREAALHEAARQEAARLEADRQDAARKEAARQEVQRKEAARQEKARVAAAQKEAAQQEAAKQGAVASAQASTAKQRVSDEAAARERQRRREARKRKEANTGQMAAPEPQSQELEHTDPSQEQAEQSENDSFVFSEPPLRSKKHTMHQGREKDQHARSLSGASSAGMATSAAGLPDLAAVLNEFQWRGSDVSTLESQISERLTHLSLDNVSNVVSLDSNLDELDALLSDSIVECSRLDEMMAGFAVQLAAIGDEVQHIEGQGDGLQIMAVNTRALRRELEDLLSTVNLPSGVSREIENAKFGDVSRLSHLEEALAELYRAVRVADLGASDSLGTMRVLTDRKDVILKMATSVAQRFEAFWSPQVTNSSSPEAMLSHLYVYAGIILFIKDTVPEIYTHITGNYESWSAKYFNREISAWFKRWNQGLESTLSRRPPFVLQVSQHSVPTASSTRELAMRKSKSALRINDSLKSGSDTSAGVPSQYQQPVALPRSALLATYQSMEDLVDTLSTYASLQQHVLVKMFHMSSFGAEQYDSFVRRCPVSQRRAPPSMQSHEVDPSKLQAQAVLEAMGRTFTSVSSCTGQAVAALGRLATLESIYLIGILEARQRNLRSTDQEYLNEEIFGALRIQLEHQWSSWEENQTRSILGTRITTKKRVGVLPVVTRFTEHVAVVELALRAAAEASGEVKPSSLVDTRKLLDSSHETLYRALVQGFHHSLSGTGAGTSTPTVPESQQILATASEENKEELNRHVTLIENMYTIFNSIQQFEGDSIESIVLQAKQTYRSELEIYIADVIHRPLGKVVDFVRQQESQSSASRSGGKSKHSVASLKKSVTELEIKELRRNVDTLRKRVDKHFGEGPNVDPGLIDKVWKAIEATVVDYYNRLSKIAHDLDSDSVVDVQRADIQSIFR